MRGLRSTLVRLGGVALAIASLDVAPATAGMAAAGVSLAWRQFHGGPGHAGVNTAERAVGAGNVGALSLKWMGVGQTSEFSMIFRSSPAITRGVAFFGATDGNLYAFSAVGCGQG